MHYSDKISINHSMNSNRFITIGSIVLCMLFCTCTPLNTITAFEKHAKDKNYYLTCPPPDGIKITSNLYYDQTEVSNTNWREYEYWTKMVYGSNSVEYKSTLPDTLAWIDTTIYKGNVKCLKWYISYYLRHPAFMDYPVIGITQKQAIDFSKWRSDRVMEFMLVTNNKIQWDSLPTPKTCFTIERYFTGNYKNIKPDTGFKYYPGFRLPTIAEWKRAVQYTDSVNKIICKDSIPKIWCDIEPCLTDTSSRTYVTINVFSGFKSKKHLPIYNLRGNVGEWTSEDGVSIGGGWADKRQIILAQDTFHVKKPNAWTGFRNVCEWKKWTK
jgi:hypothetical protein